MAGAGEGLTSRKGQGRPRLMVSFKSSDTHVASCWRSRGISQGWVRAGGTCRILPESPRWLLMNGKLEEAKQMLCYAAGVNKKTIPLSLLDKVRGLGPGVGPGQGLQEGPFPSSSFQVGPLPTGCPRSTV